MPDRIDGIDIIPVEEYFSKNGAGEEGEATLPKAPMFPLDALPDPIAELARVGAESISCPEDYLAVAALTVVTSAIGVTRVARIKSSWLEPSILFTALIGPSGDGKSPAEQEATLPISKKQKSLFAKYKLAMKKYAESLREYKVEEKKANKENRVADAPPEKPTFKSVFVQDVTPEALVAALYKNPRGLLRIEDELAGMVASFDQYKSGGKGRERDMWLSIWTGHQIKSDRKGDEGTLYVPNPRISLVGNVQPKMIPRLLPYGEDHDGFAARILLSYPNPVHVEWTDTEISDEVRAKYQKLIEGLHKLEAGLNEETHDEDVPEPLEISFTPEARARFSEYFNETTAEARAPGFDDRLHYPWAKFRGYCARVALVLAMCRVALENAEEKITLDDVNNAVEIMNYFKAMARRTYAGLYGQRPDDRLAAAVVALLEDLPDRRWYGSPSDGFTKIREVSQDAPASAPELCKKLEKIAGEHPVLRFEHGRNPSRARNRYWLLELVDDEDPGPDPPENKNPDPDNGVRSVRSVRKSYESDEKGSNGEVIAFPSSEIIVGDTEIDEALEALVEAPEAPGAAPLDKPAKLKKTKFTEEDFLGANEEVAERHNLIYRDEDLVRLTQWLETVEGVALDTETYSPARTKKLRRKEALSFVKGKIRLVQLSSGGETYFLDAMFLSTEAVVTAMEQLKGKTIYCHNGIFDLPRIKRHFGVDLLDEDIRDTMILSRLARAGEWVDAPRRPNRMRPFRHDIRSALLQEGVAQIPNETDHDWHLPLNESRLVYARDDVQYLHELHERLVALVDERDLGKGYELFKSVFPIYLKMQYRGVPFDKEMFEEFNRKLDTKLEETLAKVEQHAPPHPEGGSWSWRNNQCVNENDPAFGAGRNGAPRALHEAGISLKNLKKPTRIEYLKNHPWDSPGYPLLEALHEYLGYADLKSDCKDWLDYHYEDGRLYPNVKAFSQETGRSAYSNPALQNIPKDRDPELEISLRDCIRAPEGHRIVKADYAAQELRILAHVAGDEALVASFAGGADPHVVVGEQVAGHALVPGTDEYKMYRKLGKRANYGFSYGAGPARYAQSVYEDTAEKISEEQARAEQKAFRKAWPGVYRWQKDFGARTGEEEDHWYTESFVGRIRYVGQSKDRDGIYTPNYCDRLNGPIQSGGADMLYLALQKLLESRELPVAEIIITTHDEIVLEIPETEAETAELWLYECMREALQELLCPELATEDCVEAKAGPSWGGR